MVAKFTPEVHVFRFYEDGSESGSSPIAAEDTNLPARNVTSDSQVQLRLGVQEIGAGSIGGASTDDYQLQYLKNSGGGWQTITGASSNVKADTGSTLSDGSASTDRATDGITDGGGSFVAGEQEAGDGEVEDHELTADNWTEHVFALTLISADLADADFLDFRLRINGGSMTNSVTPRITVDKPAGVTVAVPAATLTVTGKVPVIAHTIPVGKADLSIAGQIPTVALGPWAQTIPEATLTVTGQAPTVALGPWAQTVPKADLVVTGQVPTVQIAVVLPIPKADLTVTGQVPVVGLGPWAQTVPKADLAVTGQALTLDELVPVGKADLVTTGQAPTLAFGPWAQEVPKADLSIAGQAVTLEELAPVANAALTIAGQVPTLAFGPWAQEVPKADLIIAGKVPGLEPQQVDNVEHGHILLTALPPSVDIGNRIDIPLPKADLAIAGQIPVPTADTRAEVPAGALAITGQAVDDVGLGPFSVPIAAALLTIVGHIPTPLFPRSVPSLDTAHAGEGSYSAHA